MLPAVGRFRDRISQNAVLAQVQFCRLVHDDRPPVLYRLVVQEICRLLSAARLVRPLHLVARSSLGSSRFRKLWRLADGMPKVHSGDGADCEGPLV